jgi:hypothetical protein
MTWTEVAIVFSEVSRERMEKLWEWRKTSVRIGDGNRPDPARTSRARYWSASTTSINQRSKAINIMKTEVFWNITPCTLVNYLPIYTAQNTGRLESSGRLLWEPRISQRRDCWIRMWSAKSKKNGDGVGGRRKKSKTVRTKTQQKQAITNNERSLPLRVIVCQNVVLQRQLQLWEVFTHPSETKRASMWNRSGVSGQNSRYSPLQKFCRTG